MKENINRPKGECVCNHCHCDELDKVHDVLSCNCGNCNSKASAAVLESRGKNGILSVYGFDILKLCLALCILITSAFLPIKNSLKLILYVTSAVIVGYELFFNLIKNLSKFNFFDENALMLIASVTAFLLGECLESALILILFNLGELLEHIATKTARSKIAGLAELKAVTVHLSVGEDILDVKPETVAIGSVVIIKKGERVPVDGELLSEFAVLDLKAITGESRLCSIRTGDEIYGGSINAGDPIKIRSTKLYKDSLVEKIISSIEVATAKKARSQKFITTFAKIYTPIVVILGILIAVIPPLIDGFLFSKWIYRALTFLVVSCPCALVISVPLSFFVGIGNLARSGIMVKGSNYVDLLAKTNVAIFDKTGTLTEGKFTVDEIALTRDFEKSFVLSAVASIETVSTHPLANAIVCFCKLNGALVIKQNVKVHEITGKGLFGLFEGKRVLIGNDKLLKENDVIFNKSQYTGEVVYIAIDNKFIGELRLSDKIKSGALECISQLKRLGVKTMMLSGDMQSVAEDVGERLGLDKIYSELMPEEKLAEISKFKISKDSIVVYVGDGVNDTSSLAAADVGVAMGGLGSMAAIESADIVIMDDDVQKLTTAIKQSKKIKRIVTENIFFSLATKVAVMLAGVFFSLPVWIAIFADVGVMILAVVNSLRAGKSVK